MFTYYALKSIYFLPYSNEFDRINCIHFLEGGLVDSLHILIRMKYSIIYHFFQFHSVIRIQGKENKNDLATIDH